MNAQNVGVGTTTPQSRLHIVAPSGYTFPLLQVEMDGLASPYLIVQPDGRVGIGVANPAEVLDVSGNVQFSGALMPAGDAGTAGFVLMSQGVGNPPVWVDTALFKDNWGNQVAVTQGPIVGDGTSANPIGLQAGTNSGDILIWDGTQWVIKSSPFDSVCGTAMANYVMKWTGTELCNSIIYDDGIRVGIGTNSPQGILEIQGPDTLTRIYLQDSFVAVPMITMKRSSRDMVMIKAYTASTATAGHIPRLEMFRADGTISLPLPTRGDQWLGAITVGGMTLLGLLQALEEDVKVGLFLQPMVTGRRQVIPQTLPLRPLILVPPVVGSECI